MDEDVAVKVSSQRMWKDVAFVGNARLPTDDTELMVVPYWRSLTLPVVLHSDLSRIVRPRFAVASNPFYIAARIRARGPTCALDKLAHLFYTAAMLPQFLARAYSTHTSHPARVFDPHLSSVLESVILPRCPATKESFLFVFLGHAVRRVGLKPTSPMPAHEAQAEAESFLMVFLVAPRGDPRSHSLHWAGN